MESISGNIVNRVAQSDLVTFNLEDLWDQRPVAEFDLAPFLFREMVLREKDFRASMKAFDWAQYADSHVAVFCSADAIIPTWAWMLVASKLEPVARSVALGRREDLIRERFARALESLDWSRYEGKPVVVKGCGSDVVPPAAYLLATTKLQQVAAKLMYGEACSSVPLWRKPRTAPATLPATLPDAGKPQPPVPVRSIEVLP